MKPRRFESDARLWLHLASVLFVVLWFCPWAWFLPKYTPGGYYEPPALLWLAIGAGWHVVIMLGFLCALYSIPAVVLGWVLHCFVVIARQTWKDKRAHAV